MLSPYQKAHFSRLRWMAFSMAALASDLRGAPENLF